MKYRPRLFLSLTALLPLVIVLLFLIRLLIRYHDPQTTIALTGPHAPTQAQSELSDLVWLFWLQTQAKHINTSLSAETTAIPFVIETGEALLITATKLQDLGLISDAQLFRRFLHFNRLDTSIEAGYYTLRRNMTMKEIGLALQQGRPGEILFTIPEGWRAEQIAERLTQNGVMDGAAFMAVVREGTAVNHPLLADRPRGQSYEGYLYPNTYLLPLNVTPEALIQQMLNTLAHDLPADAVTQAAQQGLTFYEALTIAAIVEREAVVDEDRSLIASVYLNRLNPSNSQNFLQSDATVQYAMGYQVATGQWWKTPVVLEEFAAVDSPYNTYQHPGLPPGPIANPGAASIIAALQPAKTDYYFFMCAKPNCEGGHHVFAETYEEHLANVRRYYGE